MMQSAICLLLGSILLSFHHPAYGILIFTNKVNIGWDHNHQQKIGLRQLRTTLNKVVLENLTCNVHQYVHE
jgi:hypothetical protein